MITVTVLIEKLFFIITVFLLYFQYNNNVHFEGGRLICSPYLVIIGPSEARDDNDKIRVANESFARKINIITIITHFQVYVLLQFAES